MSDPLSEYTEAVIAYQKGNSDEAAESLSRALGAKDTLPVVRHSIDKILEPSSPLMPSLLNLLAQRSRRVG